MNKFVLTLAINLAAVVAMAAPAAPAAKKAEKPPIPTYTTPEQGGQDYVDQGEYVNDWGGAQVIALGKDRFRMVIYKGGLPGAGWDMSPQSRIEGTRDGGKVALKGTNGWTYTIANGAITINSNTGEQYTMKKIERKSPTLGAQPPAGAVVLFDGSNADAWKGGHMDNRNLLQAGTTGKQAFTNFTLHLEFLLPFKPEGRGQDRGNSGVYVQDRYEIQVLDSFGLNGEDNECGGVYTQLKPAVNMCFPPLTWQTYDIDFEAPKWDENGKKVKNAVLTLKHNGVVIHDRRELKGATPGGGMNEVPKGGPIQLQGHGNPVFYRNMWVVEK